MALASMFIVNDVKTCLPTFNLFFRLTSRISTTKFIFTASRTQFNRHRRPPGISRRIEYFLTDLNTRASQGIPVGPAASIIMAEATLIDVDQFIYARGFEHVRYVDDFRIFGNSLQELQSLLQDFCVYLHENQRLSLSSEKTRISKSEDFIKQELNNQISTGETRDSRGIEVVNPYTMEVEDVDLVVIEDAGAILLDALTRITKFETLDLGVIRAIVRRARAHAIKDIAGCLMEHIAFFARR